MKTLTFLASAILLTASFSSFADDRSGSGNKKRVSAVAAAPFVWGEATADAPSGLAAIKAKNAWVPVAPFTWGEPDETVEVAEVIAVPVAPFAWGDADTSAPAGLQVIAVNADVPVPTYIMHDTDAEIPVELASVK